MSAVQLNMTTQVLKLAPVKNLRWCEKGVVDMQFVDKFLFLMMKFAEFLQLWRDFQEEQLKELLIICHHSPVSIISNQVVIKSLLCWMLNWWKVSKWCKWNQYMRITLTFIISSCTYVEINKCSWEIQFSTIMFLLFELFRNFRTFPNFWHPSQHRSVQPLQLAWWQLRNYIVKLEKFNRYWYTSKWTS